jgi:peptidoglycan/LPS O-acetylase OafA/YrhL
MSAISNGTKRLSYLDSARGLAALSVTIWHFLAAFLNWPGVRAVALSPLHLLWYGQADVLFFFIHSGFILAYAYANQCAKLRLGNYSRFYVERIFRIYPLFLFVLLGSFLLKQSVYPLVPARYTSAHLQTFWAGALGWHQFLKEGILFYPAFGKGQFFLIPQGWTLSVEILVCPWVPVLALLLRNKKWAWTYWPVVFILLKIFRLNTYLFEFALGVFLYYQWSLIRQLWSSMTLLLKGLAAAVCAVLYSCFFHFVSLFTFDVVWITPGLDRLVVAAGCGLIFCILLCSLSLEKILSVSFLVSLGRACYSIYLVHMLILICFADYLMQWLHSLVSLPEGGYLIILFIIYITGTTGISFLTYKFIERPFNQWGKRIGRWAEQTITSRKQKILPLKQPIEH